MYSSTEGRWLSPDPKAGNITNPQSLDRYAYVLGNPTNLVDPLGLDDFNPGDPCSDFFFAITNAECPSPDQTIDLVDFFFLLAIFRDLPGYGGGGGGGGSSGGGSINEGEALLGYNCLSEAEKDALKATIVAAVNERFGTDITDVRIVSHGGTLTVIFNIKDGIVPPNGTGPLDLTDCIMHPDCEIFQNNARIGTHFPAGPDDFVHILLSPGGVRAGRRIIISLKAHGDIGSTNSLRNLLRHIIGGFILTRLSSLLHGGCPVKFQ